MFKRRVLNSFSNLKDTYLAMVKEANKAEDPMQLDTLQSLQKLNNQLLDKHEEWKKNIHITEAKEDKMSSPSASKQSENDIYGSFFGYTPKRSQPRRQEQPKVSAIGPRKDYVKGLYLWGSSGCGKTFLCDIFFKNLQIREKKKVHFHEFMAGIHRNLFKLQKEKQTFDPLATIAFQEAKQSRLLFLDEFQVTDVADATMLKRLFERMISHGLVLLATSNREPSQLYKNGIQRELFVPFIAFLQKNCEVKRMNTDTDYRYLLKSDPKYSFLSPVTPETDLMLDQIFIELTGTKTQEPVFLEKEIEVIPGRNLRVPRSKAGVCMYTFNELCDSVMGDSDFRAICRHYKAIVVKHIPHIDLGKRNVANRFIKLLDEVYNNKVKLYCNAETNISELTRSIKAEEVVSEEEFAINRCKSRLVELQSREYKAQKSYWEQKRQTEDME